MVFHELKWFFMNFDVKNRIFDEKKFWVDSGSSQVGSDPAGG